MSTENTFRTKTGFCHVLPDKILLSKDGNVDKALNTGVKDNMVATFILYGIIALVLMYSAYSSYIDQEIKSTIFFGFFALLMIYGIIDSLNNSSTPVVEKKDIIRVNTGKGIPLITSNRFQIVFRNENGKTKKRLIMLPSGFSAGNKEYDAAIELLKQQGYIS